MSGFSVGVADDRTFIVKNGRMREVCSFAPGFGTKVREILERWDEFLALANFEVLGAKDPVVLEDLLNLCVPATSNVYAVGVNYYDHVEEAGMETPREPMVFAKFPSCLTHGRGEILLTSDRVDWEAELVVVIGKGGRNISRADWKAAVAGFCVGQDISDRRQQFKSNPPQFSLGKSAKGFGPVGPYIRSLDSFIDPDDLEITCKINGETVQHGRTGRMIFSVGDLIEYISHWSELRPGDLIFTGTPGGTGGLRSPRRYLRPGDILETSIEGIGTITNTCL